MKIARCTPSRGLVHSRTEQTAETARDWAELHGHQWRNFWTHNLPIPNCFNNVVMRAHNWGADLVWILEEDVALHSPGIAFPGMMAALANGADVAVIDYTVGSLEHGLGRGITRDGANRFSWCGTGCILLKRACFDALPRPWFTMYPRLLKDGAITWQSDEPTLYGVDVEFTHSLLQLGFKFQEIDARCDHLRIIERGQLRTNDGRHRIEALPIVPKRSIVPPRRSEQHGSS